MEDLHAGRDRRCMVLGGTVLAGICVALLGLIGRLVHINTALADRLSSVVEAQQIGWSPTPGRRGFIYDGYGRVLAASALRPSVFADPQLIDDVVSTARKLAPVLGQPASRIEQTLRERKNHRFCRLARNIDPADARAVKALGLTGVVVRDEPHRYYPMQTLIAQTIGFVGRDDRGLEGVELMFDDRLRGVGGRRTSVYDGRKRRRPIWARDDLSSPPRDGGHAVLTIDSVIQGFVEEQLAAAVEKFEAESAVGIVMDPTTGDILAMAQHPTYDPNAYGEASAALRRNRVLCDAVEPGSIFKPFIASGALQAGVVDREEVFHCGDGEHYFGRRLMHDTSPHGELNLTGIVAFSSNIGMGMIGQRMGNRAIHNILLAFGFGKPTGVGFPGEAAGLLRPLKLWSEYSTTSLPIGQEIGVTPLQMATAFCAIVNGGTLVKPRLVRALLDAGGSAVETFEGAQVVRRVLSRETADYVRTNILTAVVNQGGGHRAALEDWQVAGKTGTAQVPYRDRRGYEPEAYIGSFIGAVPAEAPRIVALVMVHRPNAHIGYYGGLVAAPAFREIAAATLAYLNVAPSEIQPPKPLRAIP